MTLGRPDRHDAASPMLVKLVEHPVGAGDKRGQRGAGNRHLAMAPGGPDEHQPTPDFNLGRLLRKITRPHNPSPLKYAERFGIKPNTHRLINPLNAANDEPPRAVDEPPLSQGG